MNENYNVEFAHLPALIVVNHTSVYLHKISRRYQAQVQTQKSSPFSPRLKRLSAEAKSRQRALDTLIITYPIIFAMRK